MNARHHFDAPWGRALKVITTATTVLVCIPGIVAMIAPEHSIPLGPRLVMMAVGPAVLFIAALFMVKAYEVEQGVLRIRRWLWSTSLQLDSLRAAEVLPRADLKQFTIRLAGNGGLFSFTGWFYNRRIGVFRMFVTDLDRMVLLTIGARKVLVSPDDPQAFTAMLRHERRLS